MEVYAGQTLLDVVVATDLADEVLCGSRRAVWDGRPLAIAWGRLSVPCADDPGHRGVAAFFARGRRWRPAGPRRNRAFPEDVAVADVIGLAGQFWVALADGRFDTVTVVRRGSQARRRLASVRPRPAPFDTRAL